MGHLLALQVLMKIRQTELLKEADVHRLLREASPSPTRRWLTLVLWVTAGAAVLSLLIR